MSSESSRELMTLGVEGKSWREVPKLSFGEVSSNSTQWSGKGCLETYRVSKERRLLETKGVMVERGRGGRKYVVPYFPLCPDTDEQG